LREYLIDIFKYCNSVYSMCVYFVSVRRCEQDRFSLTKERDC